MRLSTVVLLCLADCPFEVRGGRTSYVQNPHLDVEGQGIGMGDPRSFTSRSLSS